MLEEIGCAMLILAYSVTCYLVGKGDLLTLIPTMLQDKLEQVTKERKERQKMNEIKVLVKKPGEFPLLMTIENSLEALQKIVGGYIETVSLTRELVVICDEEGRLKGKEHCCNIAGADFVGTIIIAGIDGDDFGNLPVTYHDLRRILPELWRDIK